MSKPDIGWKLPFVFCLVRGWWAFSVAEPTLWIALSIYLVTRHFVAMHYTVQWEQNNKAQINGTNSCPSKLSLCSSLPLLFTTALRVHVTAHLYLYDKWYNVFHKDVDIEAVACVHNLQYSTDIVLYKTHYYYYYYYRKTRMVWLPDGENVLSFRQNTRT